MKDAPAARYTVRPARMDDHSAIASFTRDTFEWGDYIVRVYKDWIADRDGCVLVAADPDDAAVAMAKIVMLSPTEAWAQGARVHPDHRRRGLATRIGDELNAWAKSRGGRVVRLIVEDWNDSAGSQVRSMGMRPVAPIVMMQRDLGPGAPVPKDNGGRRRRPAEPLRTVPSAEAGMAFLTWQAGPLAPAARGLFSIGWRLRRLTEADLESHAKVKGLWDASIGSAISSTTGDEFWVGWLDTRPDSATDMARAILDIARKSGASRLGMILPAVPWLIEPFSALGCEMHPMTVFAKAL